jgi:hypothetical protein
MCVVVVDGVGVVVDTDGESVGVLLGIVEGIVEGVTLGFEVVGETVGCATVGASVGCTSSHSPLKHRPTVYPDSASHSGLTHL